MVLCNINNRIKGEVFIYYWVKTPVPVRISTDIETVDRVMDWMSFVISL